MDRGHIILLTLKNQPRRVFFFYQCSYKKKSTLRRNKTSHSPYPKQNIYIYSYHIKMSLRKGRISVEFMTVWKIICMGRWVQTVLDHKQIRELEFSPFIIHSSWRGKWNGLARKKKTNMASSIIIVQGLIYVWA